MFISILFPSLACIFQLHLACMFYQLQTGFSYKIHQLLFSASVIKWLNINLDNYIKQWSLKSNWYYFIIDFIVPRQPLSFLRKQNCSFFVFYGLSKQYYLLAENIQFLSLSICWCLRCQSVVSSLHLSLCSVFPCSYFLCFISPL